MSPVGDHALLAYEPWAEAYDDFTAHHDYEAWTATIERATRAAGLRGRRLLDVACGTGKSFLPFLDRGYDVVACDLSPAMARLAAAKAGDRARVEVHDMRVLPRLGAFDLVCCLDDAVNYLTGDGELASALARMAANLAPGGVLAFDANTLETLRTAFSSLDVVTAGERIYVWDGLGTPALGRSGCTQARIEVLERGDAGWVRTATVHRQRHHPEPVVRDAVAAAGLELVAVHGFTSDGRLWELVDDERHSKALYIARAGAHDAGIGEVSADAHRDHRERGVRVGRHQGQLTQPAPPPAEEAGGGRRYRLRPSIELVPVGDDVLLLRAGEPADLAIRGPDRADRVLLDQLAERAATTGELTAAIGRAGVTLAPDVLQGKLRALLEAGAVVVHEGAPAALAPADAERFARQLPYLAERGDPEREQQRLRDATVVVLGCGGLGTWTLAALASLGIGSLVLVDDDRVELSNLNRQILYGVQDVGRSKVDLAAAWVARFDPAIAVRTESWRICGPDDLAPLLAGADALVHAADTPPYELERWVNAACLEAGVPWIASGQMPPALKVGPTYVPGRSACFACHERQLAREHRHWPEVLKARTARPAVATTLGPASGLLGTMVALQLLDLLTADGLPATAGRALLIDMRTLAGHFTEIARDPGCPACSSAEPP